MLAKRLAVGLAAVLVWGLLSRTVSDKDTFISNLLSGLSNFCFFVVGQGVDHFFRDSSPPPTHGTAAQGIPGGVERRRAGFTGILVRTALAVAIYLILVVTFGSAGTISIDQMAARGDVLFNRDGYRDIQTYLTGFAVLPLLLCMLVYFFHLGATRLHVGFSAVLAGTAVSLGLMIGLYLVYGAFGPLQIAQYLELKTPKAASAFDSVIIPSINWALTALVGAISILLYASLLWMAAFFGKLMHPESRARMSTPFRKVYNALRFW